jgi:hypothetical protein
MLLAVVNIAATRVDSLRAKPLLLGLLGADAILAILWFASMASNAALVAKLTVRITCLGSYKNGTVINNNVCVTKRTNPYLVVGPTGKGILYGLIVLSLLELYV